MTPFSLAAIIGTVFMLAVGQVLFKFAANGIDIAQKGFVGAVLLNKWLIVALVVYFVATVLWLLVLRKVPLKLAYPFVALAFIFVPVLGTIYWANHCACSPFWVLHSLEWVSGYRCAESITLPRSSI